MSNPTDSIGSHFGNGGAFDPSDGGNEALDPGHPTYEAARASMVAVLRSIARRNRRSGFAEMADDLAEGDLMQVPTWIALQMLARITPTPASEAAVIERCAQVADSCTIEVHLANGLADGAQMARRQIATAIRALITPEGTGDAK